jgi:hypothetical protein
MKWLAFAFAALLSASAHAQSLPVKFISAASTNSNLVRAGRTTLHEIVTINTTTTIYYLKLYNKVTAPVCGTDTPLWTVPVPFGASNAGGGIALPTSLFFPAGLGFCLTGAVADNDTTPAATGIVINLGYGS